jgi:amino acid transporter
MEREQAPTASGFTSTWEQEKRSLRRHFRRFDVLFFLICTLVGLDTIGSVAANGPEGLTWMVLLGIVFFVPYGLLVAELGSAFPLEGGPYVWTKLAFGRLVAGLTQVLYWISNPLWVGGTLTILALTTWKTFFTALPGAWEYVFGLGFIWFGVLAVLLSPGVGKWIPTAGAIARIVLMGLFTVTVVVYAIDHGVQGLGATDFKPTYVGFIALVPILIFNYVGFELPSTAAEEMKDPQRDIPFAVFRSGIAAVLLYGLPILGILLVLPAERIGSLGGFIDACKAVFTVYGGDVAKDGTVTLTGVGSVLGKVCAAGLILGVLTSGVTWAMGGDRGQAVACADGTGPRWLGRISPRFGTPVNVNVLSGVMATIVMVAALNLTHGNGEKYFTAGLGLAISTTFISYIVTFPALAVLRRRMPDVERPFEIPGGQKGVNVVTALTTLLVTFTVLVLLWPGFGVGWFGTSGNAADSLPESFAGQRLDYTLSQLVPLAIILLLGVLFYAAGTRTRREIRAGAVAAPAQASPSTV